ncbi:hypothetical protein D3C80_1311840 [compost metagenome]
MSFRSRRQVDDGEGRRITHHGRDDGDKCTKLQGAQENGLVQRIGEEIGIGRQSPAIGGVKALRQKHEDRHEKDRRRENCGGQGKRQRFGPVLKHGFIP